MEIRNAIIDDAEAISSLVMDTAKAQLRNEFTDDGWVLFQRLLSVKTQVGLLKNKAFNYRVAVIDNEIIGVLASKNASHLFHFFIHPNWQCQGVGGKLWASYLQSISTIISINSVSVNASDFAVKFYLKIGFTIKQPRKINNGMCFTAMEHVLALNEHVYDQTL
ncbi:MAG: GNAT family N-acetyltransferase [Gammaproteobacteria bacterium]|nr:GNAT family N-acetyltransferase [Gammaproteobacteria bacterium]